MSSWTFFGSRDQSPKRDEQRPSSIVGTPPSQTPVCVSSDAESSSSTASTNLSPGPTRKSSVRNGRIFTPSMARDCAGSVAGTSEAEGVDTPISSFPPSPLNPPSDSPGSPLSLPMLSPPESSATLSTALGSPARKILKAVKREDDWRVRNKANPFVATRALPIAKLEMEVEVERAPYHGHTLAHLYESSQRKHVMQYGSLPSEQLKVIPQISIMKAMARSMSTTTKATDARAKRRHSESSLSGDNVEGDYVSLWDDVKLHRARIAREKEA